MNGQDTNTSDWLFGAVKKNPEGLLLLAAGAVLLMRKAGGGAGNTKHTRSAGGQRSGSGQRPTSFQNDSFADGLTDGLSKAAAGAKDYVGDMAERTSQTVGSVASSASEYADQARRTVSRQSEWVVNQAQSTMERVLQDQPLVVALAGLAAGAAVAATFPTTDFEKETLGPIGEQVSGAASRVGEQLKEATAKAGEKLKNVVDEKGLTPSNLKEVASEVAGAFGTSMAGGGSGSGSGSSNAGQTNSTVGKGAQSSSIGGQTGSTGGQTSSTGGQTSSTGGKPGQTNPTGGKTAQTNPTGGHRG